MSNIIQEMEYEVLRPGAVEFLGAAGGVVATRKGNIVSRKQLLSMIILGILGFALLAITAWMHEQIQISAKRMSEEKYLTQSIIYFFLFFLFGILIEWKKALKVLSGKIHLNKPLFMISIALVVISLIPPMNWYMWHGLRFLPIP